MVLTRSMNKEIENIILIFKSSYPQNCNTTTMYMHLNKFMNFMQYQQRVKMTPGAYNIVMKKIDECAAQDYMLNWGDEFQHLLCFQQFGAVWNVDWCD
tara:strand:+ start:221 stop:514 length:294 start_codon:yes stop_codon:yes gene_type:complete